MWRVCPVGQLSSQVSCQLLWLGKEILKNEEFKVAHVWGMISTSLQTLSSGIGLQTRQILRNSGIFKAA